MKKLIAFNWKLNPATQKEAEKISKLSDKEGVIIFAPFVFLHFLKKKLEEAELGAQNVFWEEKGAFTGEISPLMLKDAGVKYVLLGHSERRRYFGEDYFIIKKKIKAVSRVKIKPVICVGEDIKAKKKGIKTTKNYIKKQLQQILVDFNASLDFVVAYEPVWAIGGGRNDNPQRSEDIICFIKNFLKAKNFKKYKVIYGGSVDGNNAKSFLNSNYIDGVLVGSASLRKSDIIKILS